MKWLSNKKNQYAYSISLHEETVHIAILKAVSNPISPEQAIEWRKTSWELIVNDEIDIVNGNTPAAMTALLKRYEKFTTKKQPLQLVLGLGLIEEVIVDKPDLPDEEIAATLQWTLKDLVTIPAADIVADFYDPPVQASGSKKIQVIAASRAYLQPVLDVLHAAQFDIQGIVYSILAISRWFDEEEQLVLVSESQKKVSQLQIVANKQLVLNRALTRVKSLSDIAASEMDELEALALEVQRSLDFYNGQLRQAPLSHICVASAHPQAADAAAILGSQLGLESSLLAYPAWASELKECNYKDMPVLAGLIWLTEDHNIEQEVDA